MALRLIVDSSCDLPTEIVKEYNIKIVPLIVNINGKEYLDGVDIDTTEFYAKIKDPDSKPSTSQVTPERFSVAFNEVLEAGDDVICITIGSNASGTCQSAFIAKEELNTDRVTVIDSNMLCMGTGYIAILAAKFIREGKTAQEIKEFVEPLTQNQIEHLFSVDTMEYLKRGGRVRASKAMVAELLNIKPVLNVHDGLTQPIGKVRGRRKIIPYFLAHIEKTMDFERNDFLSITHSEEEAFAEEMKAAFIEKFNWTKPVYISELGATIGTHTGPGVLAAFYIKK